MHPALNRLRGRAAPRDDILDRLLRINPRFRVNWAPPSGGRPGFWEIHEYRQDHRTELRRKAGAARRARFLKQDHGPLQRGNPGVLRQAEDWIDGLHFVAAFPEEQWGGDWMFRELGESEQLVQTELAALDRAIAAQARDDVEEERSANPEFDDYLRTMLYEEYHRCVEGFAQVGYGSKASPASADQPAA